MAQPPGRAPPHPASSPSGSPSPSHPSTSLASQEPSAPPVPRGLSQHRTAPPHSSPPQPPDVSQPSHRRASEPPTSSPQPYEPSAPPPAAVAAAAASSGPPSGEGSAVVVRGPGEGGGAPVSSLDDYRRLLAPLTRLQLIEMLAQACAGRLPTSANSNAVRTEVMRVVGRSRAHRRTYVKNLPYSSDQSVLIREFSRFGEIEEAVVVRDHLGRSRGYGFVTFQTMEAARRAATTPMVIDRRQVLVGIAADMYGLDAPDDVARRKLFVRNLPHSVTPSVLERAFAQYGKVHESVVLYDRYGMSRGFGFVTFTDVDAAHRALLDCEQIIHDRLCFVHLATERQNGGGGGSPSGGGRLSGTRASMESGTVMGPVPPITQIRPHQFFSHPQAYSSAYPAAAAAQMPYPTTPMAQAAPASSSSPFASVTARPPGAYPRPPQHLAYERPASPMLPPSVDQQQQQTYQQYYAGAAGGHQGGRMAAEGTYQQHQQQQGPQVHSQAGYPTYPYGWAFATGGGGASSSSAPRPPYTG